MRSSDFGQCSVDSDLHATVQEDLVSRAGELSEGDVDATLTELGSVPSAQRRWRYLVIGAHDEADAASSINARRELCG